MDFHHLYLDMALLMSKKSKDASTQCGAVIVGPSHEVRSTGYNSFPRGVNDDVPERQERPLKYSWIEHAERNALYNAARMGVSLSGCCIYQDWLPCTDCARGIIQCGISQVIVDSDSPKNGDKEWDKRWGEQLKISIEMFRETELEVLIYHREKAETIPFDKKAFTSGVLKSDIFFE